MLSAISCKVLSVFTCTGQEHEHKIDREGKRPCFGPTGDFFFPFDAQGTVSKLLNCRGDPFHGKGEPKRGRVLLVLWVGLFSRLLRLFLFHMLGAPTHVKLDWILLLLVLLCSWRGSIKCFGNGRRSVAVGRNRESTTEGNLLCYS